MDIRRGNKNHFFIIKGSKNKVTVNTNRWFTDVAQKCKQGLSLFVELWRDKMMQNGEFWLKESE